VACVTLACVRVQAQHSLPMRVEQVVRSEAEKAVSTAKAAPKKPNAWGTQRRPGRPKGSQHKPKADGTFTPELLCRTGWLEALRHLGAEVSSLPYLVLERVMHFEVVTNGAS
jgi:hypothetical protein